MELMILGALILLGILLAIYLMIKAGVRKIVGKKDPEPEPKKASDAWVAMMKAASGNPEMEEALAELLNQHLK